MKTIKVELEVTFLSNKFSASVKHLKKSQKGLGFELQLRTSIEKQNILYTTLGGNDVNVTINSIYLYIPSIVPSAVRQQIFNDSL